MARLPSTYYPSYLKLDLQIGMPSVHPLASALDDALYGFGEKRFRKAWRLQPSFLGTQNRRAVLQGLGLDTSALSDSETRLLFETHPQLFRCRGTTKALQQLATLYFGPCELSRGRPKAPATKTMRPGVLQLLEGKSGDQVVFIRCQNNVEPARVDTFLRSCPVLLPEGMTVQVAPPLCQVAPKREGFLLYGGIRLDQRRI